jgi:hypothetical protein
LVAGLKAPPVIANKGLPLGRPVVTELSSGTCTLVGLSEEPAMNTLPTPMQTSIAVQWLASREATTDRVKRVLLSHVDGHRNVIELESFARAMGLEPDALEKLRHQGLIDSLN